VLAKTVPEALSGVKYTLSPDGTELTSGGSGAVQFKELEPGPYSVAVALTGELVGVFEVVDASKGGTADAGQRLDLDFTVNPTELSVKISGPDALDGATVAISGAKSDSKTTTLAGIADFGRVPAGHYDIKVTIKADGASALKYQVETKAALDLSLGKTVEHPVALTENPPLEVTVLTREPALKNIESVKVTIKGGTHQQTATTGSNGVAKFDHVPLVEHTLDFEFTATDVKLYEPLAQAKFTPAANSANATTLEVKPKVCELHLALVIKLPDDTEHALPKDLAVTLRASDNSTIVGKLDDKGVFVDGAGKVPLLKRSLKFSLEFPKAVNTWLVFEKTGAGATQELVVDADPKFDSTLCQKTATGCRALLWLQADAKLIEIDAEVSPADHFTKPDFDFKDKGTIGEALNPVKVIVKPKWQHLRFEYFDRKYGKADHGGKRISIPTVILKASRKTTDGTLQDLATGGNFVVDPTDNDKACQALPWIVTKKVADGTDLPKLTKQMYFQFGEDKAWIESTSKTERAIVKLDAAGTDKVKLAPSKDRSKYYDLPKLWTNCFQVTRLPADKLKFFDELTDDEIEASYDKAKPLKFSLDDIVLVDGAGAQTVKDQDKGGTAKALSKHSRFAILHLDPDDKYNTKIWKPRATAAYHSDLGFTKEDGVDTVRNVLADYPLNARAVLFCSGVHHIYNKRTEAATFGDKHIKGVRAAKLDDADVSSPKRVFNNNADRDAGYVHKTRVFPMYYLHYGDTDGTTVYGILLTLYTFRFFDDAHKPVSWTDPDPITNSYADVRKYQEEGLERAMKRWNGRGYQIEQKDDKTEFVIKPFFFFESKNVEDPLDTINEVGGKHICDSAVGSGGSWATETEMYMRLAGYSDETLWGSDDTGNDYDGNAGSLRCALAHELGHAAVGLWDDYITSTYPDSDVPSYAADQRYPGVPYNIDPLSIMNYNRVPRLRMLWGRVLWINKEAQGGGALEKFVGIKTFRAAYEPSGKTKLKHFLTTNDSLYKPAKQELNADLGDNGKAHLYLYSLGEDEFTAWMQNGPYDGMVILDWNLCVDFVNHPVPATLWATTTVYAAGTEVKSGVKYYRCTSNHTASALFATDAANWLEIKPVTWDDDSKRTWIEDIDKRFRKELEGDPNEGRFKLTSSGTFKKVYVRGFPQWQKKAGGAPAGTHFTIVVKGDGTDAFAAAGTTINVANAVDAQQILRYILGRYTAPFDKKSTLDLADFVKIEAWIKGQTGDLGAYTSDNVKLSISGVDPLAGAVEGGDVTIKGTNLSDVTSVKFGAVDQPTFTKTATQITCKVPVNAVTAKVKVSTSNRSADSAGDFKVLPAITSVDPSAPAAIGAAVTIHGTTLTAASAVKFGTVAQAVYTVDSAIKITTTVPATAVTAKITVTTAAGTATSPSDFTVIPVPTVSGFLPASAKVGDDVTITGTGLDGATAVKIGGVLATIKSNTATQIVATIGGGAASGDVEVTTPGGNVTKNGYTLTP
jgi:hypothetical protein